MQTDNVFVDAKEVLSLKECDFYHTMDLPEIGIVHGLFDLRSTVRAYLGNFEFNQKRVLEIGTASGFICFSVERAGAEVVAYDLSPEFSSDVVPFARLDAAALLEERKSHIGRLNNSFWLAHKKLQSRAKVVYGTVYQIPPEIGPVDVSIVNSVLLHVRDPFLALQQAASFTKETMIVTDALGQATGWKARVKKLVLAPTSVMRFAPNYRNGSPTETWWYLTPQLIQECLGVLGFEESVVSYHEHLYTNRATVHINVPMFTIVATRTVGRPNSLALSYSSLSEHLDSTLVPPSEAAAASAVALAESELRAQRFEAAAAVARMVRRRAPDETASQQLESVVEPWLDKSAVLPAELRAGVHFACARTHRLFGEFDAAKAEYHAALALEPDMVEAHVALSELKMPGEFYLSWLERLHAYLQPRTYLEIGVDEGRSLSLARPPTLAVGVDPAPTINCPFETETQVFRETSDEFFARENGASIFGGLTVDLVFIDGLHMFQQALKDFMNAERLCSTESMILFHDTVPLDEVTQRPDRQRQFYTGDVWKCVLLLRTYRPDLDIITIATPWSGLTVVTSLDPTSNVLQENFANAVERFQDLQYETVEHELAQKVNLVPNDWSLIKARLRPGDRLIR